LLTKGKAAIVGLAAVALAISACSSNKGSQDNSTDKKLDAKLVYVDDAKGPAPAIKDAKNGGVVTILGNADFDHFYPQAAYRGDALMVGSQLVTRTLTGYYEEDGKIKLMGDLATTTGKSENNCQKWTYTLRDNIKFEDGTPITSKNIAYGISRAFDSLAADGPSYIQRFLAGPDWSTVYPGPFKNKGTVAPGIATPDDKTLVFNLAAPHCDFPLAAALLTTAPAIAEKDDPSRPEALESPIASGPYKIKSYTRGEKLVLERNPNWVAASDPLRHNYVDGFIFDWTATDPDVVTKRLVADQGDDKMAIQWNQIPSSGLPDVEKSAEAQKRIVEGETVYSNVININTKRITDVDVRRALIYGINKQAILQIIGGDKAGKPSTTLVPPVTPGHKDFDVYPAPLTGNVDKAKQLLQGKTLRPLKYCYRAGGVRPQTGAAVKEAYARIGVEVVLAELDRTTYYNIIGKNTTDCDLIPSGWGQDYPSDNTYLGILAHKSESKPEGSNNNAFLENDEISAELDRIALMPDIVAANKAYGDLEEKIFRDQAPWVPLYYAYNYTLVGSAIGGVFLSSAWGAPSLQDVSVK
jgi:peptide/nickel transport system substrate-binding protein